MLTTFSLAIPRTVGKTISIVFYYIEVISSRTMLFESMTKKMLQKKVNLTLGHNETFSCDRA